MFTIRKATSADCGLIHKLAWQIFPETYKEILSKELWGIERSGFFNGREKWAKGFENQRV